MCVRACVCVRHYYVCGKDLVTCYCTSHVNVTITAYTITHSIRCTNKFKIISVTIPSRSSVTKCCSTICHDIFSVCYFPRLYERYVYCVAAHQYVVVVLYGDLLHATSVVVAASKYVVKNRRVHYIISSRADTHVVSKTEGLTSLKLQRRLLSNLEYIFAYVTRTLIHL